MPSISDIKQVIKIVFRIKDFTISLGSFKSQIKQIIIMTQGTTVAKFRKGKTNMACFISTDVSNM